MKSVPYSRSLVTSVAALPLTEVDRRAVLATSRRAFGRVVFEGLSVELQQTLRKLCAAGVRSL